MHLILHRRRRVGDKWETDKTCYSVSVVAQTDGPLALRAGQTPKGAMAILIEATTSVGRTGDVPVRARG